MTTVVSPGGASAFDPERLIRFLEKLAVGLAVPAPLLRAVAASVSAALPPQTPVDSLLALTAETLASRITDNASFSILAGRVEARRLHRNIPLSFAANFQRLRDNVHPKTGAAHPLVAAEAHAFVQRHAAVLNAAIAPERDDTLTYFGMRTLCNAYLLQTAAGAAETPQYMFMRVAVGVHGVGGAADAVERVLETYDLMSRKYFIHSSPTLFNAATDSNYLSSCFLVATEDDSIDGIYKTLHKAALISKGSGGIGLHVHDVRSQGSLIKSSNGTSSGLVPMLQVFNSTARYVDQGGNKRPGAIAVYLEPWHGDIMAVLELRKNHGKEELRARDLFYALWIPDLFMRRVKENGAWSLFSPSDAPGLADTFGADFDALYERYEQAGLATATLRARKLWTQILQCQTETGMPFMLYKDACNRKSNQQNLGTIKSSNLCCEIVEYSSPTETAVCNLASLALPSFVAVSGNDAFYDFHRLHQVTKTVARNLDRVIDVTKYPVADARVSNTKHRPIAIGVQGLADTFMELRVPFESEAAKRLNRQIFETIYHAALEASVEMALESGPYSTFAGSPASKGVLQFDMWGHKPAFFDDWDALRERIRRHGLRNSLLVAPMPTASTSQILGFNECFEPFTSNLYSRRVLAGEFQVVNKYLVEDLMELGLWNSAVKDKIIMDDGSVQNIDAIPAEIKALYKTVWEISQKTIVDMAADRGCFVDQSQSMNIHLRGPTFGALTSCHFYAWEKGLKTGMYYLRTQAAARAIQFTVDPKKSAEALAELRPVEVSLKRRRYREATFYKGNKRERTEDLEKTEEEEKRQNGGGVKKRARRSSDSAKSVFEESDSEKDYTEQGDFDFEKSVSHGFQTSDTLNHGNRSGIRKSTDRSESASAESLAGGHGNVDRDGKSKTNDSAINSTDVTIGGSDSDEDFIYDTTPVACRIQNPENCDACSG